MGFPIRQYVLKQQMMQDLLHWDHAKNCVDDHTRLLLLIRKSTAYENMGHDSGIRWSHHKANDFLKKYKSLSSGQVTGKTGGKRNVSTCIRVMKRLHNELYIVGS